ncbi:MAG: alpha/beta hydrolase [Faecalibacterium sp.]|nr:alpha/beta hydrolase [Faecalibacterium sp.]
MAKTVEQTIAEMVKTDAIRDAGLTVPEGIDRALDLAYGPDPKWHLLDIYTPAGATGPLPAIISIHGGGWIYGDKELYSHYCMRLAKRGFAVVNFNYRLAPQHQYPAPLQDTARLLHWLQQNAAMYHIDLNNLFMVGDSAGGQLCYQILTALTNPVYAALCSLQLPKGLQVRACGLNCGCYFIPPLPPRWMGSMLGSYLPTPLRPVLPQLNTGKYLTAAFPPAFVMSAENDYLKFMAAPLHRLLCRRGVESELHIYGAKEQKEIGHVFHLNCRSALADRCNDEQCTFFRRHLAKTDTATAG